MYYIVDIQSLNFIVYFSITYISKLEYILSNVKYTRKKVTKISFNFTTDYYKILHR